MTIVPNTQPIPAKTSLGMIIAVYLFSSILVVEAQPTLSQLPTMKGQDRTFQSIDNSFSLMVPEDWTIQEAYSSDTKTLLNEILQGSRLLAQLCPHEQAPYDIDNGANKCEGADENMYIQKYPNLADESELVHMTQGNISNQDLINYQTLKLQKLGRSGINIIQTTNTTIDVISDNTNRTIATVPASIVEMTYRVDSVHTRGYFMLSATNATSNVGITSGYVIQYEGNAEMLPSDSLPEPVNMVFQSFEFIQGTRGKLFSAQDDTNLDNFDSTSAPSGGLNQYNEDRPSPLDILHHLTSTNTTLANRSINEDNTMDGEYHFARIVQAASTMTHTAYSPNPVEVTAGDTIEWINEDSSPHTITSGQPGTIERGITPDLLFEGEKFSFVFNAPGAYPYFCILHPNMQGKVIVAEK